MLPSRKKGKTNLQNLLQLIRLGLGLGDKHLSHAFLLMCYLTVSFIVLDVALYMVLANFVYVWICLLFTASVAASIRTFFIVDELGFASVDQAGMYSTGFLYLPS